MKINWLLLAISFLLFVSSLFSTSLFDNQFVYTGFVLLIYGHAVISHGIFAWLANIFGPLGFLCAVFKKYEMGFILAMSAFFVGLQTLMLNTYLSNGRSSMSSDVEIHLGIGFYMWEASFFLIALLCFLKMRNLSIMHIYKKLRK